MEKTSNSDISTNQFIIVRIGNEQYGINIKIVDNIVRMQQITRVPKAQNTLSASLISVERLCR